MLFFGLQQKPVFFWAHRATSPVTGLGQWGNEEIWSQFSQDRGQQGRNASRTKGAAAALVVFFGWKSQGQKMGGRHWKMSSFSENSGVGVFQTTGLDIQLTFLLQVGQVTADSQLHTQRAVLVAKEATPEPKEKAKEVVYKGVHSLWAWVVFTWFDSITSPKH